MGKKIKPKLGLGLLGAASHGASTLNAAIGKVLSPWNQESAADKLRPYLATVRKTTRSVWILAKNGAEAKQLLEKQHGVGNVTFIRETDETPRNSHD